MAPEFVTLNVVRKSGPGDCSPGIRARSSAPVDGSLCELRKILLEDEVIQSEDKFYFDGRAIGKTAEAHIKWADMLREILVIGNDMSQPEITCTCGAVSYGRNGLSYPGPYDTALINGTLKNVAEISAALENQTRYSGKPRRPDNFITAQRDNLAERNAHSNEDIQTNVSVKTSPTVYTPQLNVDITLPTNGAAIPSQGRTTRDAPTSGVELNVHSHNGNGGVELGTHDVRATSGQVFETPRFTAQSSVSYNEPSTNGNAAGLRYEPANQQSGRLDGQFPSPYNGFSTVSEDANRNRVDVRSGEQPVNGSSVLVTNGSAAVSTTGLGYQSNGQRANRLDEQTPSPYNGFSTARASSQGAYKDVDSNGLVIRVGEQENHGISAPVTHGSTRGQVTTNEVQYTTAHQHGSVNTDVREANDYTINGNGEFKPRMRPLRLSEDLSLNQRTSATGGSPRSSTGTRTSPHPDGQFTPTRARYDAPSRGASLDGLRPVHESLDIQKTTAIVNVDYSQPQPQPAAPNSASTVVGPRISPGLAETSLSAAVSGEVAAQPVTLAVNPAQTVTVAVNGTPQPGPISMLNSSQSTTFAPSNVQVVPSAVNNAQSATYEAAFLSGNGTADYNGTNDSFQAQAGSGFKAASPSTAQVTLPQGRIVVDQGALKVGLQTGETTGNTTGFNATGFTLQPQAGNIQVSVDNGSRGSSIVGNSQTPVASVSTISQVSVSGTQTPTQAPQPTVQGQLQSVPATTVQSVQVNAPLIVEIGGSTADLSFEQPRDVGGLNEPERRALVEKSGLGVGLDTSEAAGPKKTGFSPLANIDVRYVSFDRAAGVQQEVVIARSARAAAYTTAGWAASCLSVEHPWVTDDRKDTMDSSTAYVAGRYVYSACTMTLVGDHLVNPELQKAVEAALSVEDCRRRSSELDRVFRQYGHVYPVVVELGGMKQLTCVRQITPQKSQDFFEAEMKAALVRECGAGNRGTTTPGPSVNTCDSALASLRQSLVVSGGSKQETDFKRWSISLTEPTSWAVTRVMRVESVLSLFDAATRAKILEATPHAVAAYEAAQAALAKVPLYRLYSEHLSDHLYTSNAAERDHVKLYGYQYEFPAGQILATPAENSVPFFRIYRNREHFYTTDVPEKQRALQACARDEGVVGFVYNTRQTGTIPLYRLYSPSMDDHFYTISAPERDTCLKTGSWNDEGVACYVYP